MNGQQSAPRPPPPLKMLTSTHHRCDLPTTAQGLNMPARNNLPRNSLRLAPPCLTRLPKAYDRKGLACHHEPKMTSACTNISYNQHRTLCPAPPYLPQVRLANDNPGVHHAHPNRVAPAVDGLRRPVL